MKRETVTSGFGWRYCTLTLVATRQKTEEEEEAEVSERTLNASTLSTGAD